MKKQSKATRRPGCFRRWSRKGYGIFASLGREVKIGVLAVGMSILSMSAETLYAQDTTKIHRVVRLDSLTVVGKRTDLVRGVIMPERIYDYESGPDLPQQSVEGVLRTRPSIDVRERGAKGVQSDLSIRGGSYDQTMVLLDGVDFSNARTGHQSHSLPIDMEALGGIDLLTGIALPGALAGAVNLIPRQPARKQFRATAAAGAYGYFYSHLSANTSDKKRFRAMGAFSLRRSDGYIANTDFETWNGYFRASYHSPHAGVFDFQAGYQDKAFGANGFYSPAYPDQFEATATALSSLRWGKEMGSFTLNATASYMKNYDRYELFRDGRGAPATYAGPNYHNLDHAGVEVWADYRYNRGKTSVGANCSGDRILSTVLGEPLDSPVKSRVQGIDYTHGKNRRMVDVWLRQVVFAGRGKVGGNVTLSNTPYGATAIWSLSGEHPLANRLTVEACAMESMRLPTFTDLYYNTPTHIGNADLVPEKAFTMQAALRYNPGRFAASALGYYRQGRHIIDWIKPGAEAQKWEASQATTLDTYGLEGNVAYSPGGFVKTVSLGYSHIVSDKNSGVYLSKYALDYMRDKLSAVAALNLSRALSFTATATWYNRNGGYEIRPGVKAPFDPYLLVDAKLSWARSGWGLYVDAANLFGADYFDFGGIVQPGLWVIGGLTVSL